MERLVIVSNRIAKATDKKATVGGLAVALQQTLQEKGGVWFGWSGKISSNTHVEPDITKIGAVTYATIDLSRKNYTEYYNGFANRSLWPLFHYRLDLVAFSKQNYQGYLQVNTMFADRLLPLIEPDDLIWVHDYHLIHLGEELRRANVSQPIGFFLHIPFPAMEILTALPSHDALVRALCAYDLIGFQTENDLRAFLDYIIHEAKGRVMDGNRVHAYGRTLRAGVFPIGIDTDVYEEAGAKAAKSATAKRLLKHYADRPLILGVDRLDYSKGLLERFHSFEHFLESYPAYHGKVNLIQIAPPSRSEVPEYKEIRHELEAEAGFINGRFAEFDWLPIAYLSKSFSHEKLAAFYRASRIGLVTPLRDGMNLVAKEYVAVQNPDDPGVLVLSRFAGAARELDGALIINPLDFDAVADAIARGLEMPREERIERWSAMMEKLRTNTLSSWTESFLDALRETTH